MQKMVFFLCIFFAAWGVAQETPDEAEAAVVAESYWKFHHSAYVGYQRDRQQFNAFGSGLLDTRTKIQDRNSMQLIFSSHAEFKNLVGYLRGSYGWLVSGHTVFRSPGFTPPLSFPHFNLGAGYSVDVRGAVAYRIAVHEHPNLGFFFLPGVGYRYAHMMNFPEGAKRYSLPGTSDVALSQFPKPNQQDWFGFFVEGRIECLFKKFYGIDLFCQYHQPYLVSTSEGQVEIDQFTGGTLSSDQLFTLHSVLKAKPAQMVLGGMSLKFHSDSGWTFGTHFEGGTNWSKSARDHVTLKTEQFLSTPVATTQTRSINPATLRWTFYSISLMVDRRF